jgi:hypothetical protein
MLARVGDVVGHARQPLQGAHRFEVSAQEGIHSIRLPGAADGGHRARAAEMMKRADAETQKARLAGETLPSWPPRPRKARSSRARRLKSGLSSKPGSCPLCVLLKGRGLDEEKVYLEDSPEGESKAFFTL